MPRAACRARPARRRRGPPRGPGSGSLRGRMSGYCATLDGVSTYRNACATALLDHPASRRICAAHLRGGCMPGGEVAGAILVGIPASSNSWGRSPQAGAAHAGDAEQRVLHLVAQPHRRRDRAACWCRSVSRRSPGSCHAARRPSSARPFPGTVTPARAGDSFMLPLPQRRQQQVGRQQQRASTHTSTASASGVRATGGHGEVHRRERSAIARRRTTGEGTGRGPSEPEIQERLERVRQRLGQREDEQQRPKRRPARPGRQARRARPPARGRSPARAAGTR